METDLVITPTMADQNEVRMQSSFVSDLSAASMEASEAQLFHQLQMELEKDSPNAAVLAQCARSMDKVPDELRPQVWRAVLGVQKEAPPDLESQITTVKEDLDNQKVINGDAGRTRSQEELFQRSETIETMYKILTFYCKNQSVDYKQGMNEVLAPFMILREKQQEEYGEELSVGSIYELFHAFIGHFLPHVFVDSEFTSLQCSLQLFRQLMLYHDPKLCRYLDRHEMIPELYMTPLFMTLFARNMPSDQLFQLWDFFIVEQNPFLQHFVAFVLVSMKRDEIFGSDPTMMPQVLTKIATLESKEQLAEVCNEARKLSRSTPSSFVRNVESVCFNSMTKGVESEKLLAQLTNISCLHIHPDELASTLCDRARLPVAPAFEEASEDETTFEEEVSTPGTPTDSADGDQPMMDASPPATPHEEASSKEANNLFYVLLDCRSAEEYDKCHLNLSYHVGPEAAANPEALSIVFKTVKRMKGCHFCFIGPSDSSHRRPSRPSSKTEDVTGLSQEHVSVTRLVLMFLQKGFEHVSMLAGGFEELKDAIAAEDEAVKDKLLVYAGRYHRESIAANGWRLLSMMGLGVHHSTDDTEEEDGIGSMMSPNHDLTPSHLSASRTSSATTPSGLSERLRAVTTPTRRSTLKSGDSISDSILADVDSAEEAGAKQEWLTICKKTRDALEKSIMSKEVVFTEGPLGLLLQRPRNGKKFFAMVDSIIPDSQASDSQQVATGDLLVAVNEKSVSGVQFNEVIELVKTTPRPLVLSFQDPRFHEKLKAMEGPDILAVPVPAPRFVSATQHSIGITWVKPAEARIRYHLQYALRSGNKFHPWQNASVKRERREVDASGITSKTYGTVVGLDANESYVFRVRCGNGRKWGPFSLSSDPMQTLDKADEEITAEEREKEEGGASEVVFLPGVCPELHERGVFYYSVLHAFSARKHPAYDADKLDVQFKPGSVIKCTQRIVRSGTNQVFVKIEDDEAKAAEDEVLEETVETTVTNGDDEDEDELRGMWAFENTPNGSIVLERLPETSVHDSGRPSIRGKQMDSLTRSVFSNMFKSHSRASTSDADLSPTDTSTKSSGSNQQLVAPQLLEVFATSGTSIAVTWDLQSCAQYKFYQVQCAKNRVTSMWWTAADDVDGETLKYEVGNLSPNTAYVFRVRGCSFDGRWSPYSSSSASCKTLQSVGNIPERTPQESTLSTDDNDETSQRTSETHASPESCASVSSSASPPIKPAQVESEQSRSFFRSGSENLGKAAAAFTFRLSRPSHAVAEDEPEAASNVEQSGVSTNEGKESPVLSI